MVTGKKSGCQIVVTGKESGCQIVVTGKKKGFQILVTGKKKISFAIFFYCVYKNLARVIAILISPSQNPLSLSPSTTLLYFWWLSYCHRMGLACKIKVKKLKLKTVFLTTLTSKKIKYFPELLPVYFFSHIDKMLPHFLLHKHFN